METLKKILIIIGIIALFYFIIYVSYSTGYYDGSLNEFELGKEFCTQIVNNITGGVYG